jgi:flavin reductase (DIM6/NTAB) family NADH-FMN oxidoreductase RutF
MKEEFQELDPYQLSLKPMDRIGKRWMLVTAGDIASWNTMTASWGFLGELWSRPCATAFVRPSRHTYGFIDRAERFSLSFFPETMKKALDICGSKSGRDIDKAKEAGLSAFEAAPGAVSFQEAELILICRKLYADDIEPSRFVDDSIIREAYAKGDFHRMYVGAIERCLARRAG